MLGSEIVLQHRPAYANTRVLLASNKTLSRQASWLPIKLTRLSRLWRTMYICIQVYCPSDWRNENPDNVCLLQSPIISKRVNRLLNCEIASFRQRICHPSQGMKMLAIVGWLDSIKTWSMTAIGTICGRLEAAHIWTTGSYIPLVAPSVLLV